MARKFEKYRLAVLDCETDPFHQGRIPRPFVAQFKSDDGTNIICWGPRCIDEIIAKVQALENVYLIYVHNGGRFDFHFMLHHVEPHPKLIGGRLIEFALRKVKGRQRRHVIRDSLAIIPVPLSDYHKDSIDYGLMESHRRELPRNRKKILAYLDSDCANLLALVSRFVKRFGPRLTIGATAMAELERFHSFQRATEVTDELMRPYYLGGRTQCFASGVLEGPWKLYDVNSMYPAVMRDFDHPITDDWEELTRPPWRSPRVWFAQIRAKNKNALPLHFQDGSGAKFTIFDQPKGIFNACSHELVPAIRAGLVEVEEWLYIERPTISGTFASFVNYWYRERNKARRKGDKAGELFAKTLLAAASGKFGQNPADFKNHEILTDEFKDQKLVAGGYEPDFRVSEEPFIEIWSRPQAIFRESYLNVGTAASITSAARAVLLKALQLAQEPVYCDTDSIVCKGFKGKVSPRKLGAWKVEAESEFIAIAGKKVYCMYNMIGKRIIPVKWASKGGELTPKEIIKVAQGKEVEKTSIVPTFSMDNAPRFITRTFRKTATEGGKAFDSVKDWEEDNHGM